MLFLSGNFSIGIPSAQAAFLDDNLNIARNAVSTFAPVLEHIQTDSNESTVVLPPDGFLSKPLVAETKLTVTPVVTRTATTIKKSAPVNVKLASNPGNHFAYGWCTYYVASKRNIPWFGNAGTWLTGARGAGFATGSSPAVGAIIVTSESAYGHVGLVDSVNGDGTITISEMNYSGFARVSSRTISTSYGAIKGYIY